MRRIQKFFDIEFLKDIDELQPIHDKMLALQTHINQDSLCHGIIQNVLSREDTMVWAPLPLASESWIQWKLRELGYEIRCHGLDIFPSDVKTLKSLMYKSYTRPSMHDPHKVN